jgi:hypothetical protein
MVEAVAFSPDGRRVLTGSHDGTARLWEAASGKPIATLRHEGEVLAVAFSPDGRTALTGGWDTAARLWEAATDKPIASLPHKGKVIRLAFSPDGRTILTGSVDGTARLWGVVAPAPDEPERLRAWARVRTGKAFDDRGVLRQLTHEEWLQAWQELESCGGDWEPPPDSRLWHLAQAAEAEGGEDWFAAVFHLDRLLAGDPDNADLRRRRDRARDKPALPTNDNPVGPGDTPAGEPLPKPKPDHKPAGPGGGTPASEPLPKPKPDDKTALPTRGRLTRPVAAPRRPRRTPVA